MIVSQGTHAHDLGVAVRFDGQIGLHAENHVDLRGILWINGKLFHAAYFGATRVTHRRTLFKPAGERKVSVVGLRSAAKGARDGKYHADQNSGGNDNE